MITVFWQVMPCKPNSIDISEEPVFIFRTLIEGGKFQNVAALLLDYTSKKTPVFIICIGAVIKVPFRISC
jgi:hypothetical protein